MTRKVRRARRDEEKGEDKEVRMLTVDEGDWANAPVPTAHWGVWDGGLPGRPKGERRMRAQWKGREEAETRWRRGRERARGRDKRPEGKRG